MSGLNLRFTLFIAFVAFSALVSCAQVGLPTAKNTEQSIAYIYPANATVRDNATTLLQRGTISKGAAQSVLQLTDGVRLAADAAMAYARAGDVPNAQASLALAMETLRQAQVYVDRYKESK